MAKKILIVDDERDLTNSLKSLFSESGYHADVAQNANEAKKKLNHDFDLIILDMKMPGIDGVSLLADINKERPNSKVIILTGYGTEYKDKVNDLKYEKFFTKPFSAVVLANTAEDILLGRKTQEDKQGLFNDPLIMPKAKLLFIDLDINYFVPKNVFFEEQSQCGGGYQLKYVFVAPKIFNSSYHDEIKEIIERELAAFGPDIVLGNQVVIASGDAIYYSITNSKYKPKDILIYSNVKEERETEEYNIEKRSKIADERLNNLGKLVREVCIRNNLYEKTDKPIKIF